MFHSIPSATRTASTTNSSFLMPNPCKGILCQLRQRLAEGLGHGGHTPV
jgi:hypothetical protein